MNPILKYNEELYLDGGTQSINAIIKELNAEENLYLEKLFISNFKDGNIATISDLLTNLSGTLSVLAIHQSYMCQDDAQAIANFIEQSVLSTLELFECYVEDEQMITIMGSLARAPLSQLKLGRVWIEEREAQGIIEAMNQASLSKLSFDSCDFGEDALILLVNAIKTSTLQTLILDNVELTDDEVSAIADCIAQSSLVKLSLRNIAYDIENECKPKDNRRAMGKAIMKSSIQILNLDGSGICATAKQTMHLMAHSQITNFDISYHTGEEQLIFIELIKKNPSITKIIWNCEHASTDDQLLTKMCELIENATLVAINLHCRQCSNEQFIKICDAIKRSSISSLCLTDCEFDAEQMLTICDLLEHHNLKKLHINNLTNDIVAAILFSIKLSSLIKFNMEWPTISDDVRYEINEHLRQQRNISNSFHKTKSARSIVQT